MDAGVTLVVWGATASFIFVTVFAPVSLYSFFRSRTRREKRRSAATVAPARDDGTADHVDDDEPGRNLLLDFDTQDAQVKGGFLAQGPIATFAPR